MPKVRRKKSRKSSKNKKSIKKRQTAAPWGNMSFNAILNSETPENHQKKKRNSLRRSKKKTKMNFKIPEQK